LGEPQRGIYDPWVATARGVDVTALGVAALHHLLQLLYLLFEVAKSSLGL
jgi:hypothetical protein